MKRSKFSEEQIACVLRQVEAGTLVGDVCRQAGVSEAMSDSATYQRQPGECSGWLSGTSVSSGLPRYTPDRSLN